MHAVREASAKRFRGGAAVTGMGCVCAAGQSPDAVLDSLEQGRRHIAPPELLDARALAFPVFVVAENCFPGGRRRSAKDTFVLADAVVHSALAQAALPEESLGRTGIVLGTTAGCSLHFLDAYAASRTWVPCTTPDRDDYFASNLALEQKIPSRGPRVTLANACTSGADAIGLALDMIQSGQCECVVCGGADALSLVPHTGFARLMIYDSDPCRPFDRVRKGLNLGEGAAALVLESVEHARRRDAAVLGHILGYGSAADAYHFTAPHPEGRGLAAAIRVALERAGLDAADLAFINAHGTATPENDKVEGRLLARLLPATPVWASKGGTGHTLGAAGALEAVLGIQALNRGRVPASLGFQTPDPEIGIVPTQESLVLDSPCALSTSLGFGGGNAALVLGRGDL
ncbi:MAG: beta-ketoacyl-[acyl-carrier-protein] synthase family protein [Deltaproteobacteria bacterium]|jgi:3-oxoacyl-[acyl-carrier-protein] synthase-1/3-oxoacyl-[acyl-carrier-protein] synthase II|nr:beta-ketoacyl-[acyl-carrier-protein] synthase family protein [Deltaproteobacteria bacterium]